MSRVGDDPVSFGFADGEAFGETADVEPPGSPFSPGGKADGAGSGGGSAWDYALHDDPLLPLDTDSLPSWEDGVGDGLFEPSDGTTPASIETKQDGPADGPTDELVATSFDEESRMIVPRTGHLGDNTLFGTVAGQSGAFAERYLNAHRYGFDDPVSAFLASSDPLYKASFSEGREHAASIYLDRDKGEDGLFYATKPIAGKDSSVDAFPTVNRVGKRTRLAEERRATSEGGSEGQAPSALDDASLGCGSRSPRLSFDPRIEFVGHYHTHGAPERRVRPGTSPEHLRASTGSSELPDGKSVPSETRYTFSRGEDIDGYLNFSTSDLQVNEGIARSLANPGVPFFRSPFIDEPLAPYRPPEGSAPGEWSARFFLRTTDGGAREHRFDWNSPDPESTIAGQPDELERRFNLFTEESPTSSTTRLDAVPRPADFYRKAYADPAAKGGLAFGLFGGTVDSLRDGFQLDDVPKVALQGALGAGASWSDALLQARLQDPAFDALEGAHRTVTDAIAGPYSFKQAGIRPFLSRETLAASAEEAYAAAGTLRLGWAQELSSAGAGGAVGGAFELGNETLKAVRGKSDGLGGASANVVGETLFSAGTSATAWQLGKTLVRNGWKGGLAGFVAGIGVDQALRLLGADEAVDEAVGEIQDAAVETTTEAADLAVDGVGRTVTDINRGAADTVAASGEGIVRGGRQAVELGGRTGAEVVEGLSGAGEKVVDAVGENATRARRTAARGFERVADVGAETRGWVERTAERVGDGTQRLAEGVKGRFERWFGGEERVAGNGDE